MPPRTLRPSGCQWFDSCGHGHRWQLFGGRFLEQCVCHQENSVPNLVSPLLVFPGMEIQPFKVDEKSSMVIHQAVWNQRIET